MDMIANTPKTPFVFAWLILGLCGLFLSQCNVREYAERLRGNSLTSIHGAKAEVFEGTELYDLAKAIRYSDSSWVDQELSELADSVLQNTFNSFKSTILSYAYLNDNLSSFTKLLGRGVDPLLGTSPSTSGFGRAVSTNKSDYMEAVLAVGLDFNEHFRRTSDSVPFDEVQVGEFCVLFCNELNLKLCLEAGLEVNFEYNINLKTQSALKIAMLKKSITLLDHVLYTMGFCDNYFELIPYAESELMKIHNGNNNHINGTKDIQRKQVVFQMYRKLRECGILTERPEHQLVYQGTVLEPGVSQMYVDSLFEAK